MSRNSIFYGTRGMSLHSRTLFMVYSLLLASVLRLIAVKIGMLSSLTVTRRFILSGYKTFLFYAAINVVTSFYFAFILGIQTGMITKLLCSAIIPMHVCVVLRLGIAEDFRTVLTRAGVLLILGGIVYCVACVWAKRTNYRKLSNYIKNLGTITGRVIRDFLHDDIPLFCCMLIFGGIYILVFSSSVPQYISRYESLYIERSDIQGFTENQYRNAFNEKWNVTLYADKSDFIEAEEGHIWETNEDTLKLFKKDTFNTLSDREKLNAALTLVDMESYYLMGKCGECYVAMADGLATNTLGFFNPDTRTIVIRPDVFEDREKLIYVVLHEVKHYHQTEVVAALGETVQSDVLKHTDVREWYDNQLDYKSSDEYDWYAYAEQPMERDSQNHADEWYGAYINYIDCLND